MLAARCFWNSFIFAARGRYLLSLFESLYPHEVAEMRSALRADRHNRRAEMLANLYERLPEIDFSRQIVERSVNRLKLVAVNSCGWSDLGTPERVAETIRRLSQLPADRSNTLVEVPRRRPSTTSVWNLAEAHASMAATV
jgi:mannose-1-phosphate guanylyltransferase